MKCIWKTISMKPFALKVKWTSWFSQTDALVQITSVSVHVTFMFWQYTIWHARGHTHTHESFHSQNYNCWSLHFHKCSSQHNDQRRTSDTPVSHNSLPLVLILNVFLSQNLQCSLCCSKWIELVSGIYTAFCLHWHFSQTFPHWGFPSFPLATCRQHPSSSQ